MTGTNNAADLHRRRFGARIRQLRVRAEFSQERLAEVSGLDRKTISRTENGVHSPRLDHILAIAMALLCR